MARKTEKTSKQARKPTHKPSNMENMIIPDTETGNLWLKYGVGIKDIISKSGRRTGHFLYKPENITPPEFGDQLGKVWRGSHLVIKEGPNKKRRKGEKGEKVVEKGEVYKTTHIVVYGKDTMVVVGLYYLPRTGGGRTKTYNKYGLLLLPLTLTGTPVWSYPVHVRREKNPRIVDILPVLEIWLKGCGDAFDTLMSWYVLDWPPVKRPLAATAKYCPGAIAGPNGTADAITTLLNMHTAGKLSKKDLNALRDLSGGEVKSEDDTSSKHMDKLLSDAVKSMGDAVGKLEEKTRTDYQRALEEWNTKSAVAGKFRDDAITKMEDIFKNMGNRVTLLNASTVKLSTKLEANTTKIEANTTKVEANTTSHTTNTAATDKNTLAVTAVKTQLSLLVESQNKMVEMQTKQISLMEQAQLDQQQFEKQTERWQAGRDGHHFPQLGCAGFTPSSMGFQNGFTPSSFSNMNRFPPSSNLQQQQQLNNQYMHMSQQIGMSNPQENDIERYHHHPPSPEGNNNKRDWVRRDDSEHTGQRQRGAPHHHR